jgi:leucyl-tRNA synthetase
VPADVNIGNIAVIMKRWLAGGKTPACSASIHVKNLVKLLRAYAPHVAEKLAPVLHIAEVIAYADGAQPEAVQLAPKADTSIDVCSKVKDLISDMRSDVILAVRMDEFLEILNNGLQIIAEERGEEPMRAMAEDVKNCLRYDGSVKIVCENGHEVIWLWNGVYMYQLMNNVVKMAVKYKMVLADPEKIDEYNDEQIYSEK